VSMHFFEDTETLFLIGWRLAGPGEWYGTLLPRMSHYIVLEPARRKALFKYIKIKNSVAYPGFIPDTEY
jgi:hypothetical protein